MYFHVSFNKKQLSLLCCNEFYVLYLYILMNHFEKSSGDREENFCAPCGRESVKAGNELTPDHHQSCLPCKTRTLLQLVAIEWGNYSQRCL